MSSQPLQRIAEPPLQAEVKATGKLRQYFEDYGHIAVLAYAAVACLSIAASQIIVIAVIALWACSLPQAETQRSHFHRMLIAAIVSWLGVSLVAAFGGVDFGRAIVELLKTGLYVLFPFCVAATLNQRDPKALQQRITSYLSVLVFGLCLAGVHSVASSAIGSEIRPRVPGPVTESGQLVLVLPILLALLIIRNRKTQKGVTQSDTNQHQNTTRYWLYACMLFLACVLAAWPAMASSAPASSLQLIVQFGAFSVVMLLLGFPLIHRIRERSETRDLLWPLWTASGLLFAVLLLNLKRGPWAGFFFELIVIGLLLSRRILVAGLGVISLSVALFPPVQQRLFSLVDHFFIEGGRGSMWQIGLELVQRFPLGLGLDNARHMRELEPSLPVLHRHMHNNLLNIAVESGWLGLVAYLWWIALVVGVGFVLWKRFTRQANEHSSALATLALCLSCALLGWQISGLVEYNFGDGEVRLVAFLFMGILLAISNYHYQHSEE